MSMSINVEFAPIFSIYTGTEKVPQKKTPIYSLTEKACFMTPPAKLKYI